VLDRVPPLSQPFLLPVSQALADGAGVWTPKPNTVKIKPEGGEMSEHGSGRMLIRLVCTDMYIDQRTGAKSARHQQVRLAQLPVYLEAEQDSHALQRGAVYARNGHPNLQRRAQRCWKCGRNLPTAERPSNDCRDWNRIIRQWFQTDPEPRVLVLDISDPTYPW